MGRKNRRKPFQCPIAGCQKRGLRADLSRHARAVHPEVTHEAYLAAMARGEMIGSALKPTAWVRWILIAMAASTAFSIALALLVVAMSWVAHF